MTTNCEFGDCVPKKVDMGGVSYYEEYLHNRPSTRNALKQPAWAKAA